MPWEVALGCAGKRNKKFELADAPIIHGCQLEDITTCHLYSASEIPFPHEEADVSAAPTRESSFRGLHRSSGAEAALSSATRPRQTDGERDLVSERAGAEVIPWAVACHACCAPITGAVFMGFDRAYCSATACHKHMARATGSPLADGIGLYLAYGMLALGHTTYHSRERHATRRRTSPNAGLDGERERLQNSPTTLSVYHPIRGLVRCSYRSLRSAKAFQVLD